MCVSQFRGLGENRVRFRMCSCACGGKGTDKSEVGRRGLSPKSSGLVLQVTEKEVGYLQ